MTDRLTGHVALVTGGGRGIGRAIAERLYRDGAELAICGTTESVLRDTANALQEEGGRAVFWQRCDAGDEAAAQQTARAGALRQVDLVNNAAVTLGQFRASASTRRSTQLDRAVWDANLHINLTAPRSSPRPYTRAWPPSMGADITLARGRLLGPRQRAAQHRVQGRPCRVDARHGVRSCRDGIILQPGLWRRYLTDRMVDAATRRSPSASWSSTPMARTERPDDVRVRLRLFAPTTPAT